MYIYKNITQIKTTASYLCQWIFNNVHIVSWKCTSCKI